MYNDSPCAGDPLHAAGALFVFTPAPQTSNTRFPLRDGRSCVKNRVCELLSLMTEDSDIGFYN